MLKTGENRDCLQKRAVHKLLHSFLNAQHAPSRETV